MESILDFLGRLYPKATSRVRALPEGRAQALGVAGLSLAFDLQRPEPTGPKKGGQWLYVAVMESPEPCVKVGTSGELSRRMRGLATSLPYPLRFVTAISAGKHGDHGAHPTLRAVPGLRMRGEWYTAEALDVFAAFPGEDECPLPRQYAPSPARSRLDEVLLGELAGGPLRTSDLGDRLRAKGYEREARGGAVNARMRRLTRDGGARRSGLLWLLPSHDPGVPA